MTPMEAMDWRLWLWPRSRALEWLRATRDRHASVYVVTWPFWAVRYYWLSWRVFGSQR